MLQVGRPRVCFACAAALAMVTEGQPDACDVIEQEGGIQALVQLLTKGGGQGKKVDQVQGWWRPLCASVCQTFELA